MCKSLSFLQITGFMITWKTEKNNRQKYTVMLAYRECKLSLVTDWLAHYTIRPQKTERVAQGEATSWAACNVIDRFRSDERRNLDFCTNFMKILNSLPLS